MIYDVLLAVFSRSMLAGGIDHATLLNEAAMWQNIVNRYVAMVYNIKPESHFPFTFYMFPVLIVNRYVAMVYNVCQQVLVDRLCVVS